MIMISKKTALRRFLHKLGVQSAFVSELEMFMEDMMMNHGQPDKIIMSEEDFAKYTRAFGK